MSGDVEMPRKSTAVTHRGHIAVIIPKKLSERIGLHTGDDVKVFLNSLNGVRVEKVGSKENSAKS
jgi:antitoxin component of MazEF toxin-antitoxin module